MKALLFIIFCLINIGFTLLIPQYDYGFERNQLLKRRPIVINVHY